MICGCNEDGKTASCHNCIHGKHCQKEVCVNEETTTEEPDYEPEPALRDSDEWNGEESVWKEIHLQQMRAGSWLDEDLSKWQSTWSKLFVHSPGEPSDLCRSLCGKQVYNLWKLSLNCDNAIYGAVDFGHSWVSLLYKFGFCAEFLYMLCICISMIIWMFDNKSLALGQTAKFLGKNLVENKTENPSKDALGWSDLLARETSNRETAEHQL